MRKIGRIVTILKSGGVAILPTDTLYGIVGSALSRKAVARIYRIRRRNPKKPMIILISDMKDLEIFRIKLHSRVKKKLRELWPGKVSIIFSCPYRKFSYLHRGTKTLAFRLPATRSLRSLLKKTGPLVAPSANLEGKPPAKTITEAKKYFGNKVDFYLDQGRKEKRPSSLITLKGDKMIVLR